MTTPAWITAFVGVLGFLGVLAGQWLVTLRQVRLAVIEREVRRDERAEQYRERERQRHEEAFAGFLTAARSLNRAAVYPVQGAELVAKLAAVDDALALLELRVPALAAELPGIFTLAERLTTLCASGSSAQVVRTAANELEEAVRTLRARMHADLSTLG